MSKKVTKFKNFEWIDLTQPSQLELEEQTASYNVDVNLLQDALEHGHLPKIEIFSDFVFLIFRSYTAENNQKISSVGELSSKIAFFIKENQLLTIHRAEFDFFEQMHDSYEHPQPLLIDLVNSMLLSYENPLEWQSDQIDQLEKNIFLNHTKNISMENLYFQKAKARITKKILQLSQLVLNQYDVKNEYSSALQDLKDTTVSLVLQSDEIIEDSQTILNAYLGINAQKSNDTMKLLTIFSAFFLPLTFIAGIYGMNFDHMPELKQPHGYYFTLIVMAIISIVIYLWFKRKKII